MWMLAGYVVVLLHAAYLVYQTFGALLGLHDRRWLWVHPFAVMWGVGIVAVQGQCPATLLEKYLTSRSGGTPYEGSFLDHYFFGTVVPDGTQSLVYGLHLVVIAATYVVVRRSSRARRGTGEPVESSAAQAVVDGPGSRTLS